MRHLDTKRNLFSLVCDVVVIRGTLGRACGAHGDHRNWGSPHPLHSFLLEPQWVSRILLDEVKRKYPFNVSDLEKKTSGCGMKGMQFHLVPSPLSPLRNQSLDMWR